MPRLRCLAGPSPDKLVPITINSSLAHDISSDVFQGKVAVFIKFDTHLGGTSDDTHDEYFSRPERKGVTWSVQVQGRFLQEHSVDDILFGNTFDRPLHLPWGSGAVLKFMHLIDPSLEHDLGGQKPWALSPLVATMPYFHHKRLTSRPPSSSSSSSVDSQVSGRTSALNFPGSSITDDISKMETSTGAPVLKCKARPSERRRYFKSANNRRDVLLGPNDLITTDFAYGFLQFPALHLVLPAGISFDLKKYWDGQPVRFICCERGSPENPTGGRSFWCVVFEIVTDDEVQE